MKRGKLVLQLSIIALLFLSVSTLVIAQENETPTELKTCSDDCKTTYPEEEEQERCIAECKADFSFEDIDPFENNELYEGYENEELKQKAGSTPGSAFYFIDKFFDRFGDDIKVKEERIAEIKQLIEAGDIENAKVALAEYIKLADKLEHEIDPERREEAKRSAAAIRNAMKDIRDKLPPEERGRFVSDIVSREHKIATAAEIAGKIKALCTDLAKLDPTEYSRICKTDDDAPEWQKKLHRDLSKKQREIAKEFVGIMKECFKTSGQDCRCEDIPFPDFADACSQAAPLATACDIDGDERACEKLDEIEMPELPDYLQDIFDDMEMQESQYDMHMPRECVEAGVTDPRECGRIMIEINAPEECKEALLAADVQNEREGREICDKIMMKIHAPECVEAGITDPRNCRDFYEGEDGPGSERERSRGPEIDFNCQEIENPTERLECFDKAASQARSFAGFDDSDYTGNCMTPNDWEAKKQECRDLYGEHAGDEPIYGDSGDGYECAIDAKCIDFSQGRLDFEEIKERERECASNCESQNKAWDFSYGECRCYGGDFEREPTEGDFDQNPTCDDCASQCDEIPGQRLQGTGCGFNGCECYYESDEPQYAEEEGHEEPSLETDDNEPSDDGSEPSEPTDSSGPDDAPEGDNLISGNVFLDYINA